jgi:UDP-arabinose 4-epimerase
MKLKTILVTGGAGYIGSHTCKALKMAGYTPVVVDNLVHGHRWAVKWGPLIVADICEGAVLDQVFERFQPDAVIHFAAYAYVGESVQDPAKYYNNNVGGTLSLLDAMKRHQCGLLVFSSSCATYGIPSETPIEESFPQKPINPYGRSKWMIEQILKDYESAYGLRYISLRYFNAAGADPDSETGEDHDPETHLIPLAMDAALGRMPFLEIYGSDYDTSDGTAIRDYVHVSDLAESHVKAIKYLSGGGSSCCLNLGTGRGHSVGQVVAAVEQATGRSVPARRSPRRPGDPAVLYADARRAGELIGWAPHFTSLESIVETAWRWHCQHKNGKGRL